MANRLKEKVQKTYGERTHTEIKFDQLFCWDYASLSDITGKTKLKFILRTERENENKNDKFKNDSQIVIVHLNNTVEIRCSEKFVKKSSSINKKLTAKHSNGKKSDNLHSKYVIFKSMNKETFKKKCPICGKKNMRTNLKIILYKPLTRITSKSEQMKLIVEYHNSSQRGHLRIRKTLLKLKLLLEKYGQRGKNLY